MSWLDDLRSMLGGLQQPLRQGAEAVVQNAVQPAFNTVGDVASTPASVVRGSGVTLGNLLRGDTGAAQDAAQRTFRGILDPEQRISGQEAVGGNSIVSDIATDPLAMAGLAHIGERAGTSLLSRLSPQAARTMAPEAARTGQILRGGQNLSTYATDASGNVTVRPPAGGPTGRLYGTNDLPRSQLSDFQEWTGRGMPTRASYEGGLFPGAPELTAEDLGVAPHQMGPSGPRFGPSGPAGPVAQPYTGSPLLDRLNRVTSREFTGVTPIAEPEVLRDAITASRRSGEGADFWASEVGRQLSPEQRLAARVGESVNPRSIRIEPADMGTYSGGPLSPEPPPNPEGVGRILPLRRQITRATLTPDYEGNLRASALGGTEALEPGQSYGDRMQQIQHGVNLLYPDIVQGQTAGAYHIPTRTLVLPQGADLGTRAHELSHGIYDIANRTGNLSSLPWLPRASMQLQNTQSPFLRTLGVVGEETATHAREAGRGLLNQIRGGTEFLNNPLPGYAEQFASGSPLAARIYGSVAIPRLGMAGYGAGAAGTAALLQNLTGGQ